MRKRRTREHIIADLSINHVERFVLRAGFTAERVYRDYGYDLITFTFDDNGEVEDVFIAIQLKATDTPRFVSSGSEIALTIERRDWDFWVSGRNPIILVLFEAQNEVAYWLHVQGSGQIPPDALGQTFSVRFNCDQKVDKAAVMEWRRIKNNVVAQKRQSDDQKN